MWVAGLENNKIGPNIQWKKVINEFDAEYNVSVLSLLPALPPLNHGPRISNDGPLLYVRTNADAPQYKLITIDTSDEIIKTQTLIPEDKNANLVQINCVNKDTLALVYKQNVIHIDFIHFSFIDQTISRLKMKFTYTLRKALKYLA